MSFEKKKIGFIGTGVMGNAMCIHLLNAGHSLTIFTRHKDKAENLIAKGAKWVETPKLVAENSDIVCIMVGFPSDVREVLFDEAKGVFAGIKAGCLLLDFTTSEPTLAVEIYGKAKAIGVSSLDCPVSGGDIGARDAKLTIMVGGDKEAFDTVVPLIFSIIGKTWNYMGPAGAGQHTKCCNQIAFAHALIGTCESLVYAYKSGLDPEQVIAAVAPGAGGSWCFNIYGPRILNHDYKPGFFVAHFVKDLGIVLGEAKKLGLQLRGTELANSLYTELRDTIKDADGQGALMGVQALIKVLEKVAGVQVSKKK